MTHAAKHSRMSIPYILATILIIHALTEGAALGISATLPETALIFIAILAHKGSESFALCVTMMRHRLPVRHIVSIILFFALMTPVGIGLGMMIYDMTFADNQGKLLTACFDAFAAGTFLYISTLHHIRFHQHTEEKQGIAELAFLVLGLVTMGVIALLG
jgi:zinc transporter ZupT